MCSFSIRTDWALTNSSVYVILSSLIIPLFIKAVFIYENHSFFLHLFEDYYYICLRFIFTTFVTRPDLIHFAVKHFLRYFILFDYIIMAASTSTAVPSAKIDDGSRLRAVVDRTAKEVKDYTSQFED